MRARRFGGLARSAYKCVSLARLRSCTRVHSRRLASQSRIFACNLASLDSAAVAAREILDKNAIFGTFMGVRNIAFLVYYMVGVCGACYGCGGYYCLESIPRSYVHVKIRVRLMRTKEDVNENEEHFVHVGARLAPLPRGGRRMLRWFFTFVLRQKLLRLRRVLSLGWYSTFL